MIIGTIKGHRINIKAEGVVSGENKGSSDTA